MWAFYILLGFGAALTAAVFVDYKRWKEELYEDRAWKDGADETEPLIQSMSENNGKFSANRSMFALLRDKEVILCTREEYVAAEDGDRHKRIGLFSDDSNPNDPVSVSTIFLGINHGMYSSEDKWFETMIFGGIYDGEQERYEFYNQAVAGHEYWVNRMGALEEVERLHSECFTRESDAVESALDSTTPSSLPVQKE